MREDRKKRAALAVKWFPVLLSGMYLELDALILQVSISLYPTGIHIYSEMSLISGAKIVPWLFRYVHAFTTLSHFDIMS